MIDDLVAKLLPSTFRKRSRRLDSVITFGSCFAGTIAQAMELQGIRCRSVRIEEAINTTRANRLLLDYILNKKEAETSFFSEHISENERSRIEELLRAASLFIITVGVAPICERVDTGHLYFGTETKSLLEQGVIKQRVTTVDENADNIRYIVDTVKAANPAADVFLTLSPIPLSGIGDGTSVIASDVLSKSTLRVAIENARREREFHYWPSFEAVKWIAPHIDPRLRYRAFGEDDKNSRHASTWLVDIITSKFIAYAFEDKADAG